MENIENPKVFYEIITITVTAKALRSKEIQYIYIYIYCISYDNKGSIGIVSGSSE